MPRMPGRSPIWRASGRSARPIRSRIRPSRHRSTYVYEALTPLPLISGGLETPFLIDSAACLARLHEAGFLARPHRPDPQGQIADRDAYTAEWNRIDRLVRAKKGVR